MSALPLKTYMCDATRDCPLCAKSGHPLYLSMCFLAPTKRACRSLSVKVCNERKNFPSQETKGKSAVILSSLSSFALTSCVPSTDMSVEHEAIKCRTPPSSLRLVILHARPCPLILVPSTTKPPPKSVQIFGQNGRNSPVLFFFTNTLSQFDAMVVPGTIEVQMRWQKKLTTIQITQMSIRTAKELNILHPS